MIKAQSQAPPGNSSLDRIRMTSQEIFATISDLPTLDELADRWANLEKRSDGNFFSSWQWIGSLLQLTRADMKLFSAQINGKDIALSIIGVSHRRHFSRHQTRLHLNQSGRNKEDIIYPEFNDFLFDRDFQTKVAFLLFEALSNHSSLESWREVELNGVASSLVLRLESVIDLQRGRSTCQATPYVDLRRLQAPEADYLALLSSNTRSQIRRSIRRIESDIGPLTMERVTGEAPILAALEIMCEFHRLKFTKRAETSSFENPFFLEFLKTILLWDEGRSDEGRVELLELKAGSTILGYLVILVYRNMVSNYQTAFLPVEDNRLKPGLVAHTMAIRRYAEEGKGSYQFLAGGQQYKKSLSTNTGELHWLTIYRPAFGLNILRSLQRLRSDLGT